MAKKQQKKKPSLANADLQNERPLIKEGSVREKERYR
jgi:hypothetical protein